MTFSLLYAPSLELEDSDHVIARLAFLDFCSLMDSSTSSLTITATSSMLFMVSPHALDLDAAPSERRLDACKRVFDAVGYGYLDASTVEVFEGFVLRDARVHDQGIGLYGRWRIVLSFEQEGPHRDGDDDDNDRNDYHSHCGHGFGNGEGTTVMRRMEEKLKCTSMLDGPRFGTPPRSGESESKHKHRPSVTPTNLLSPPLAG
ncbi:hypothetical protein EV421DRAFT_1912642 [Armillaria borealis]|uniref:Uncharacterized protein n=1 Tax=Armillaria borealis TaxID=47425 RepID=A0AA39MEL0_9AGAR|nr:hypothetical protein EV421DRAFT_1912642 [Armillaria borealis]